MRPRLNHTKRMATSRSRRLTPPPRVPSLRDAHEFFTWLLGRSSVKLALATLSTLLTLAVGWWALGLTWDWRAVRWGSLLVALPLGLVACVFLGFPIAGWGLSLPRAAMAVNEGVARRGRLDQTTLF